MCCCCCLFDGGFFVCLLGFYLFVVVWGLFAYFVLLLLLLVFCSVLFLSPSITVVCHIKLSYVLHPSICWLYVHTLITE